MQNRLILNIRRFQSNAESVDVPISDHCSGRSGGLTGQTHALQQNEFLSFIISSSFWTPSCFSFWTPPAPPSWKNYSFMFSSCSSFIFSSSFTLSRNKTEMWDTGFSVFPLSHGFPLTSLKFYLADITVRWKKHKLGGGTFQVLRPPSELSRLLDSL